MRLSDTEQIRVTRSERLPDFRDLLLVGVDEAGRGALVGPVMAAAVVIRDSDIPAGCRDSKRLTSEQRQRLAGCIKQSAQGWGVGSATAMEIDRINIHHASLLAMRRALETLQVAYECVLVDGMHFPVVDCKSYAICGGDDRVAQISAASILAKVSRDEYMLDLHQRFPAYGFASHKGYPTKVHRLAIQKYGSCVFHRKTFRLLSESGKP